MSDLISRSALYKQVAEYEEQARNRYFDTPPESDYRQVCMAALTEITSVKHMIYDAPSVDAVPVVHGRWVYEKTYQGMKYVCSECGEIPECFEPNYCPNCGAKMDGGQENA